MSTELEQLQLSSEALSQQNEKLKEASQLFAKEEADVLMKDGNVVIRLKGMKFPSGSTRIGPENFELLAKLNKAVELYPDANVMVEGHTDSTGNENLNAKLSQERANAVKNYLLSSKVVDEDKVVSTGFGDGKPIASNKTKAGRAINRRIDIVISPRDAGQNRQAGR